MFLFRKGRAHALVPVLALVLGTLFAAPPVGAQQYPPQTTGRPHARPESPTPRTVLSHECTAIDNCSFETGAFPAWIPTEIAGGPFWPLSVDVAGVNPGFGLFTSAPTEGAFAVLNGFDGGGPGDITVAQDVVMPAGALRLNFDYRAGWDMFNFGGSTLPREFLVEIEPFGGGPVLQSNVVLTAPPGTINLDTGPQVGSVGVNAFAARPVRIVFRWRIPESFTGPGFFQLDNVTLTSFAPARNQLYACTRAGQLLAIDITSGVGTLIGPLPPGGAGDIAFQPLNGKAYVQTPDGGFGITEFDINTAAGVGPPVFDGGSYAGLEFVGNVLFGTVHYAPNGPSELRRLDPVTGASVLVGPTGFGPISGLAYFPGTDRLYGLTGGAGISSLVEINRATGVAIPIGPTGFQGGGLALGPDGNLYGGGTGPNTGELWRIDRNTGAGVLVGPTGFFNITGLTLRRPSSALFGSSNFGELFTLDIVTGQATLIGILPTGATEIEYEPISGRAFVQDRDGLFSIHEFDIRTAAGIGGPVGDGASFNGLEYVGTTLYGTAIVGGGGPSDLRILDPTTGGSVVIGPTGYGPIAGLAYDAPTATMYGVGRPAGGGGGPPSDLLTINLVTGAATVVGPTGVHLGSLQFAEDGNLYAGSTGGAGDLYRINRTTGFATLVGPSGFSSITGLTLLSAASNLYACTATGDLLTIDVTTGAGTFIGPLPHGAGEIAFDPGSGRAFVQDRDGFFQASEFDINTGAGLGAPVFNGFSFTGLTYVGGTLYGTAISAPNTPSELRILDPTTGASIGIGLTGFNQISGIAFDELSGVMFGLTGGAGPSTLLTIDLGSGAAVPIGATTFQGGGLEFGPDGMLYGGGTGPNAGEVWRIDPVTATSVLVGPSGFPGGLTGMTLRRVVLPLDAPRVATAATVELSGAMPNPSREGTLFRFSLPRGGDASFEVVDVMGRRVWQERRTGLPAGEHTVSWDGRDPERRASPAGVYFGRLVTADGNVTRKFVRMN